MNEVNAYIKGFPLEVQERLTAIRNIILELAPQATERICMRMPTWTIAASPSMDFRQIFV